MVLTELFTVEGGSVHLRGSHCPRCGSTAFPARRVCGECGCRELEPAQLSGLGSLVSASRVMTPPAGFDEPITVGIVDLDEGPRVFVLLGSEADPGQRVRVVPGAVREGRPGFRFEPEP